MRILPNTEKQGELAQPGGWQKQMARRRYQKGSIRKRGTRNPVWELQWWTDYIKADRTIGRTRESVILGNCRDLSLRQARKKADEILAPINTGKTTPYSTLLFSEFVERHFVSNVFPTLKPSTRKHYRITLNTHLLPAFGNSRLCDIGTLDIQQFVLAKLDGGLGWASCDHFRNLISKVFTTAKKWGFHSGDNPALNVELPQKTFVREKHILTGKQIPQLLKELPERIRVMVHLAILTGLRVGELLALKYRDLDWETGVLRVEQTYYRGHTGTPKTKGSKRHLPLPQSLLRTYTELQKLLRRIQINLCSRREPESRTAIPTSCTAT
jgi:integrase